MDHSLQILLLLAATVFVGPEREEDNDDANDDDPTVHAVEIRKSIKAVESEEGVGGPGSHAEEEDDSDKSSSEAKSVTADPWQEGGSEMADHASVVASGVVEGGDIV